MRFRSAAVPLALSTLTAAGTFGATVSGCTGCSSSTAAPRYTADLASSSSECSGGGGGGGKPTPKNAIEANCARDFEGPDNQPVGYVTASVEFTCGINLETVTLTISIWHSGGGSGSFGDKPEKNNTCFSILEGTCKVQVKCTEGVYMTSFFMSAIVDGQSVPDSDKSGKVTYSAGDCTV